MCPRSFRARNVGSGICRHLGRCCISASRRSTCLDSIWDSRDSRQCCDQESLTFLERLQNRLSQELLSSVHDVPGLATATSERLTQPPLLVGHHIFRGVSRAHVAGSGWTKGWSAKSLSLSSTMALTKVCNVSTRDPDVRCRCFSCFCVLRETIFLN